MSILLPLYILSKYLYVSNYDLDEMIRDTVQAEHHARQKLRLGSSNFCFIKIYIFAYNQGNKKKYVGCS